MSSTPTRSVEKLTELAARILLALLFLLSGLNKIAQYSGTAGYMESAGVPAMLLPAVIALEALGALAIIVGWKTRVVALLLAIYTVVAGLIFHSKLGDPNQLAHFLKNLSIAGAFLLLVVNGAGPLSMDRRAMRRP